MTDTTTLEQQARDLLERAGVEDAQSLTAGDLVEIANLLGRASAQPALAPEELSPEFTDTARAALLWVLWHHQGASSAVGQPIRFALGMGAHDRLNEHQIAEAKRWATTTGSTTAEFHKVPSAPAVPDLIPPDALFVCGQMGANVTRVRVESAAPAVPMTDEQIKQAVTAAVKSGACPWMGYEKDEDGRYTLPVLSSMHYGIARAVLSAAPAVPLTDTRKLCTCDGAGRGPGRACVVQAGGRLGDLWKCAKSAAPAVPAVQIGMKASTWETLSSDAQTLILEAGQRAVDKTKARRVTDAAARAMTPIPLGGSAAPAVPDGWVMVPTHLTVDQLEAFVGCGLCCGTEPMPEAVIDAGHRWTRLLGRVASPAVPAVREPLTAERLQKHAMFAADAPPASAVVLVSSLHRLLGITGDSNG